MEVSITCPSKMNLTVAGGQPVGSPLFSYELKSSSGVIARSGFVWSVLPVLTNSNYTATWTLSLTAPSTVGTYSVQVFSLGAAVNYIYCKMLPLNSRTDGPKSDLVVSNGVSSTTSTASTTIALPAATTTTVPPAPMDPTLLERSDTTRPVAVVDGRPVDVSVVESPASLELSVGGVTAEVGGIGENENALALTDAGEIRLSTRDSLQVRLRGFMPGSNVDVWLYSRDGKNQSYLGSYAAGADGTLAAGVDVPENGPDGAADLLMSGRSADGKKVSVGVPLQIVRALSSSGTTVSIASGVLLFAGAFVIFLMMRRNREEEAGLLSLDQTRE